VPNLDASDVTVSNANGDLLSTREDGTAGVASSASETDGQTAQFEDRMGTSVQQMLDRVLGPGHAVVRVNAQLDFDSTETTSQTYVAPTPSAPPLAEATSSESYTGAGGGAGGVLGQTWPTLTATGGAGSAGTYGKSERTVQNPVGTVVTKAKAAPGAVERLTVAVVLDAAKPGVDAAAIEQLVRNAVGFDAKRGDTLQVSTVPFDTTAAKAAAQQLAEAQAATRTASYLDLGKKAAIGLAVLVALFVLHRRSRKAAATRVTAVATDLPAEGMLLAPAALPEAGLRAIESGEDEEVRRRREKMRAELSAFVDSQPDEIASLVSGWLAERKG
jgi:flagellar M-ring protein FliF